MRAVLRAVVVSCSAVTTHCMRLCTATDNLTIGAWWAQQPPQPARYNFSMCPGIGRSHGQWNQWVCPSADTGSATDPSRYEWRPLGCELQRANWNDWERMRDREICIVGDSIGRQMYISLRCITTGRGRGPTLRYLASRYAVESTPSTRLGWRGDTTGQHSGTQYLSQLSQELKGALSNVTCDVVVINSALWWDMYQHRGQKYVHKDGSQTSSAAGRNVAMAAYREMLWTVRRSIEDNARASRLVVWRSVSSTHFAGNDWTTRGAQCSKGFSNEATVHHAGPIISGFFNSQRSIMGGIRTDGFRFLDVTEMSAKRGDAHLGSRGQQNMKAADCAHWCLPGLPDTWSDMLFTIMLGLPVIHSS